MKTKLFLKQAAAATLALSAMSLAQAGLVTLDFEAPVDSPFALNGDRIGMGAFWVDTYGGASGGLVGAIVDGSDVANTCVGLSCPSNNSSHFYAGLDDGFFVFSRQDSATFRMKSLDASFIGAGAASYPAVSGILVLQGFNASGTALGSAVQVALGGPSNGAFSFATSQFGGAFAQLDFTYMRVLGYACDAAGNCNRSGNLANFGVDNIVTVPEPSSYALVGMALLAMVFGARRRRA